MPTTPEINNRRLVRTAQSLLHSDRIEREQRRLHIAGEFAKIEQLQDACELLNDNLDTYCKPSQAVNYALSRATVALEELL